MDNLINEQNRSFFLNELDGFALNRGILSLATTNHPERLDPALLHRPSRFDRKFTFGLPDLELRQEYLEKWRQRLPETIDLAVEVVEQLARDTDGFTFAYLKELTLASLLHCLCDGRGELAEVLAERADALRREVLQSDE